MNLVEEIRGFNRFYTREIGLLDRHLPASDLTLPEARVLYELAMGSGGTAAEIGRTLRLDRAHLSRILARFRARDLLRSRASPEHGRRQLLSLTDAGRAAFAALDAGTTRRIEGLLAPLAPEGRRTLAGAMHDIRTVLGDSVPAKPQSRLRGLEPGDLGWIVHRQGLLYHREYGWDLSYEALVADILGRFVAGFDAAREGAWVADRGGTVVGSVFLVKTDDPATGKLRLLYVEPEARGGGLGHALVSACVARAREIGYRRLTLWTNDVLVSARRIYEAAGFRLIEAQRHRSFGKDLVGQTFVLDLDGGDLRQAG